NGCHVVADVADAAVEEAHVVGARPRGHDRLVVGHAAGAVDLDAAAAELADDGELVPADRDLDVQVPVGTEVANEVLGLGDHLLRLGREDLHAEGDLVCRLLLEKKKRRHPTKAYTKYTRTNPEHQHTRMSHI